MLLKRRAPGIEDRPTTMAPGYEHVDPDAIAVLRWLVANEVDFVLVGALARSLHGDRDAAGPVAIVAAPYDRNYARLARALMAARARLRTPGGVDADDPPIKLTADRFTRAQRWQFRCGPHDVDVERILSRPGDARPAGMGYQELLLESMRIEPVTGLAVEVASPDDLERYPSGVRRVAGSVPGQPSREPR
jgi:hypothetical protein